MTSGKFHRPDTTFHHDWRVEILEAPPLIAPTRHYIYPQAVEEVERGALQIYFRSRPEVERAMATFALGFADPSLPHGVWSCPNSRQMCAIAGGYAYVVDLDRPDKWVQIPYRPVTWVDAAPEHKLLLFASFHRLWALGVEGKAWETNRLSWEGLRVTGINGRQLHGFGWDIETDSEVPFTVDLATGDHTGSGGSTA
jgi:hypothetical protein